MSDNPQTKVTDMTSPDINTDSRPRRFSSPAAVAALALAALVAAVPAYASASGKVDGVRAAVKHGTLNVTGSDGGQQVALRLKAGDTSVIQVDAGDNGSADFSFARSDVDAINVKMGDGNDSARIDDANGAFTDSIPTTIAGGDGNDTLQGGQTQVAAENETFKGGDGNDLVDGGKGNDTAYLGDGNDTFRWDNGEGQRRDRGPGRHRHDAVQRCPGGRAGDDVGEWRKAHLLPRPGQRHDEHRRRRDRR